MIFTHSGNSGDIVFSIPTINYLTGGEKKAIVYIKPARYVYGNQYEFVKDLLLMQDGIKEVLPFIPSDNNWAYFNWPGLKYDYDLDLARKQTQRGRIHIIKRYFDAFDIHADHTKPFLKLDIELGAKQRFALIHLTPRWNGYQYDWSKIYDEAVERHGKVIFIGFYEEWIEFKQRYKREPDYIHTEDLVDMAWLVRESQALYCNQGVALTLAQGLGKEYYLVKNSYKTNTHLGTPNEHLLAGEYLLTYHTLNMPPDSHLIR